MNQLERDVLRSKLASHQKVTLVTMASFSPTADGLDIFPGIDLVAELTSKHRRTVIDDINFFIREGILVVVELGGGSGRRTKYRLDRERMQLYDPAQRKLPFEKKKKGAVDRTEPVVDLLDGNSAVDRSKGCGEPPENSAVDPAVVRTPSTHENYSATKAFAAGQPPEHADSDQAGRSPIDQAEDSRPAGRSIDELKRFAATEMLADNEKRPGNESELRMRLMIFAGKVGVPDVDQVRAVATAMFLDINGLGGEPPTSDALLPQGRIRDGKLTSSPPKLPARRDKAAFAILAHFAAELLDGRRDIDDFTFREHLKTWCAQHGIDYSGDLVHNVAASERWKLEQRIGRYAPSSS